MTVGAETAVTSTGESRSFPTRSVAAPLAGIVLALACGALLVVVAGGNPSVAFRAMYDGALGSEYSIGAMLTVAVPLIIIGLGLALAFRGRVYNIGAEGQLFVGALAGGSLLLSVHGPPKLMVLASMAAGVIGGGLWGLIVGVLRARWGVNEVITSLLLTYIAIFGFSYVIRQPLADVSAANNLASRPVDEAEMLPQVPRFFIHYGVFIAFALVPIMAWISGRTPFGFRVGMLGRNPEATLVAGVETRRLIMKLMVISGGLAGLAGVIQLVGIEGRLDAGLSANYGFTAIVVALLGRLNMFGVLFAALFVAFLIVGGQAMSVDTGLPYSIAVATVGIFVIFVLVIDRLSRSS